MVRVHGGQHPAILIYLEIVESFQALGDILESSSIH